MKRRGSESSGAETANRRNGGGGCRARQAVHRGATGTIMASGTPSDGWLTHMWRCACTEGARNARPHPKNCLKTTNCDGFRAAQAWSPLRGLTRDNYCYRESICQIASSTGEGQAAPITTKALCAMP